MIEQPFHTIIEPFGIHSVEPMRMTTRAERAGALAAVGYNLFELPAEQVLIDLLTDSGTGAMSAQQWAAIQRGNEAYAGAPSFYRFRDAVTELFPFVHVLPAHQGRAAEKILFTAAGGPGLIVPNNTHFDTTRANIEFTGARAVDLPVAEASHPAARHPFKGNMDVAALERLLAGQASAVPLVMLTVTNNASGGQPVSMANVRAVREVCSRLGKPLFLDPCRIAENAWFIRTREPGYADVSVPDIIREMAVVPFGGHAVFIDARALLPHIDPLAYPGQALACALYAEGGVRSCEIGTVMFGLRPDGTETPAPMDLVRLAIPRRTYTQSHIDYVIEVATRVAARAADLPGMRIVSQPRQLRHFTARFTPAS